MTDPAVLAIVVNWNGRDLLEPCLRTLLASSYPQLAVLVVDNASTDGSRQFVRERFPEVRLLDNDENLGFAAGANAGLRVALDDGVEYVLLMNNDTEIAPDAVAELVSAARKRPRAAFLGPTIYYHDRPDVIWSAGGAISYWSGNIRHVGIREKDVGQYRDVRGTDYVTACAVLVSVPALREIGFLDTGYFMYNEDTDWCVRATRGGHGVLLVPGAKVWHKVSMSSGGGLSAFKVYHRLRSTLRFFLRYARPYHWIGIVPATFGRACVFIVSQLVTGRPANALAVVRGIADSARGKGRT